MELDTLLAAEGIHGIIGMDVSGALKGFRLDFQADGELTFQKLGAVHGSDEIEKRCQQKAERNDSGDGQDVNVFFAVHYGDDDEICAECDRGNNQKPIINIHDFSSFRCVFLS